MTMPHYAVWLLPDPAGDAALRTLIAALAGRYGGPVFAPHVTLLGRLARDAAALTVPAATLAAGLAVISVARGAIVTGDAPFRCLFLDLAGAPPLRAARSRAEMVFAHTPAAYAPHLSLFYGTLPPAAVRDLPGALARTVPPVLRFDALALVDVAGAVADWRVAVRYPLAA